MIPVESCAMYISIPKMDIWAFTLPLRQQIDPGRHNAIRLRIAKTDTLVCRRLNIECVSFFACVKNFLHEKSFQ